MNQPIATLPKLLEPGNPTLVDFIQKAGALKSAAGSYVIDSDPMYELGTEELRAIRTVRDEVEAKRDGIVRPLNTAVKNTNALFKPITDALDEAKGALTRSMLAYEDGKREVLRKAEEAAEAERQAAIRAAEEKLAKASAEGDAAAKESALIETQMAAIDAPVAVDGKVDRGGHSRRESYEVIVENVPKFLVWLADQMTQYPDRFNNTVAFKVSQLNAFATDAQGSISIPGALVKKKSILAVRK